MRFCVSKGPYRPRRGNNGGFFIPRQWRIKGLFTHPKKMTTSPNVSGIGGITQDPFMESQRGVDKEKKVMKGIIAVGVKEKNKKKNTRPISVSNCNRKAKG